MRGSKDKPIMMQKIVSEPNPQARSTVSNAIRRISSTTVSPLHYRLVTRWFIEAYSLPALARLRSQSRAHHASQADLEKISDRRKRQDCGARQPDPQRGFCRIVFCGDDPLIDCGGYAAEDDGGRREHQRGEVEDKALAAE